MTRIFRQADADPSVLNGRTIAVVGYGNQGRAQALNLRDSNANVIIGNIEDAYRSQAAADGFNVSDIATAVEQADIVMILLPDEICAEVFEQSIRPHLQPGNCVCFASGYNVTYGYITVPSGVDLVLLAPRMIGVGVRERFQSREGFYSFVAVEIDATGNAWSTLLALASGIGTLWKGALEVTFKMETELDLFNEQAFGPAFGKVLLSSINTLVKAGYPKEAVLLEIYMSGELSYILKEMAETGMIQQLDCHSQTSQYGAISRGIKFVGVNLMRPMGKVLKAIQSGKFAREWQFEQKIGKPRFRFLKAMALRQPIGKLEREVRKRLENVA